MSNTTFIGRLTQVGFLRPLATKIRAKLVVAFLVVALIPLAVLGLALYSISSGALMDQAFNQLEAVRTIKASQVSAYFSQISNQIQTFSEDRMIADAMRDMGSAFRTVRDENDVAGSEISRFRSELDKFYTNDFLQEYKRRTGIVPDLAAQTGPLDEDSIYLQYLYIKNNANPLGSKETLDRAEDHSEYSRLHERYHPVIRSYLKKFGYNDIVLCDLESGDIVYSVFKALDFSTSLIDGPYADTNLGEAFRRAAAATSPDEVFLVDYEPYTPSYENAASFIASPIFDGDRKVGVAIFQMPINKINAIMRERTGLGRTGETYAVGEDFLFRNDSRFLKELNVQTTIINPKVPVKTDAVIAAQRGRRGIRVINDYRGVEVLSSWAPLKVYNGNGNPEHAITWALMSDIELAEVREPVHRMAMAVLGLFAMAMIVVGLASSIFAANLTKQTDAITSMLGAIGIGDYESRADVVAEDELGQVAIALNAMCDNTLSLIQSREERDQIQTSVELLIKDVAAIAGGDLTVEATPASDVTGSIADSINFTVAQLRQIVSNVKDATLRVGSSANQIRTTTEHLSKGSEAQSTQIVETTAAIGEMATSIQQVASNTNQSSEIALRARETAKVGADAVSNTIGGMERIRSQVQDTSKRIKRLGESSQEIGEIVQLISDIADRTSILALNASIQAAMAGDAGQGFAVVAEEVERLAERCNDATKQIATLVKTIQSETAEAITGMEESTKEVVSGSQLANEAGEHLKAIDGVSQQLAELIQSISLATAQQARGAEALSQSMGQISQVTQHTAAGTRQAAVAATELSGMAETLRESVSRFRTADSAPAEKGVTFPTGDPALVAGTVPAS